MSLGLRRAALGKRRCLRRQLPDRLERRTRSRDRCPLFRQGPLMFSVSEVGAGVTDAGRRVQEAVDSDSIA